ncbi:hypothetical protein JZ751_006818 [Albula glossodonta]|uniref:Cell division cycle associated 5 n=1 Tax=Albula glossodonta TaxID=121402 RepID=A0A8T2PCQ4_9TELE|nr:hypothetical protein JZ751_006818 [Albula glossodonta]
MSVGTTQPFSMEQGQDKHDPVSPHQRRRSARLSGTDSGQNNAAVSNENVTVLPIVKRSITVRKILPRKTQVAVTPGPSVRRSPRVSSESNKENASRLSGKKLEQPKMSTSTPAPAPLHKSLVLSPVLAPTNLPPEQQQDSASLEWSQKVRRSYSRMSGGDRSFDCSLTHPPLSPAPCRRETLFGFEQLQTPSVVGKRAERSGVGSEISLSVCAGSYSLLEGNVSGVESPECDMNIPGVVVVKEKRRRKRVPQMKMSEFDFLAAQMNAEFEEAESFDLVVE